jgi:hypothetical protein
MCPSPSGYIENLESLLAWTTLWWEIYYIYLWELLRLLHPHIFGWKIWTSLPVFWTIVPIISLSYLIDLSHFLRCLVKFHFGICGIISAVLKIELCLSFGECCLLWKPIFSNVLSSCLTQLYLSCVSCRWRRLLKYWMRWHWQV